jgi:hypothetical protein
MYKVIIDLVTIKAILAYLSRPMFAFGVVAGVAALVSIGAFAAGLIHAFSHPLGTNIVFTGLGLLYAALAFALLFWGLLAELIYRTGDLKLESFARLKVATVESSNGSDPEPTS